VAVAFRNYLSSLLARYFAEFIPPSASVVEIGLERRSVGPWLPTHKRNRFVHVDALTVRNADAVFAAGAYPDCIILNGVLHYEPDVQAFLERLRRHCPPQARLLLAYYSMLWRPFFQLASWLGLRERNADENWLSASDVDNLLALSGFERVVPLHVPLFSELVNRWIAPLPLLHRLALVHIVVARPVGVMPSTTPSVSIVVPARNEAGNIESLLARLPPLGPADEVIFVEGHSTDDTWARIQAAVAARPGAALRCMQQHGRGKGDAVRLGFAHATQDILLILDADLTVPPEDLPKFYRALVSGTGEFINGSRLVYPMPREAMRFANIIGNKFFAVAFTYLVGQPLKDTLCGTKVLWRKDYQRIAAARHELGEFDPFGDFDLLFGASRLGLKIVELPVRYAERTYGTTNIHRWSHGLLLLRMTGFAARKLKFI
jgi:hypothetical protein